MERAATLDVPIAVGPFPLDEITLAKALRFPVVKLLSKRTEYLDGAREELAGYGSEDALGNGQQEQESRL